MSSKVYQNRYGRTYTVEWIFWPRRVRKTGTGKMSWKMFRRIRKYKKANYNG